MSVCVRAHNCVGGLGVCVCVHGFVCMRASCCCIIILFSYCSVSGVWCCTLCTYVPDVMHT